MFLRLKENSREVFELVDSNGDVVREGHLHVLSFSLGVDIIGDVEFVSKKSEISDEEQRQGGILSGN